MPRNLRLYTCSNTDINQPLIHVNIKISWALQNFIFEIRASLLCKLQEFPKNYPLDHLGILRILIVYLYYSFWEKHSVIEHFWKYFSLWRILFLKRKETAQEQSNNASEIQKPAVRTQLQNSICSTFCWVLLKERNFDLYSDLRGRYQRGTSLAGLF